MITIDGFPLDLVESEQHDLESEITSDPVEDGSEISDNIIAKPRTLTLTTAVVSDTPIGAIASDPTRQQDQATASKVAWDFMEKLWEAREPVTVVTRRKKYESMGLETLSSPVEHKDFGALIFTAKFKKIVIVKNKRVTIAIPNGGGKAKIGSKPVKDWAAATGINAIFVKSSAWPEGDQVGHSGWAFYYYKNHGRQIVLEERIHTPSVDLFWIRIKVIEGETPDGYVLKGDYVPISQSDLAKASLDHATSNALGQPVNYDYGDKQWKHPDGSPLVQKVPGAPDFYNMQRPGAAPTGGG